MFLISDLMIDDLNISLSIKTISCTTFIVIHSSLPYISLISHLTYLIILAGAKFSHNPNSNLLLKLPIN
ncbi:unnamed protein product [Heterobilharzia americana]|nr:unnamed protein product [Heterobilharzia americana]